MPSEMQEAKRILICGSADEIPVSMLIAALERRQAPFLLLEQGSLHENVKLRWQISDKGLSGMMKVGDIVFDIRDIQSVYHRFMEPNDYWGSDANKQVIELSRSILQALMDLLDLLEARIVNRRRPMMSNNSKPYQAMMIRKVGFSIPDTCITNDRQALEVFRSQHPELIYKSISAVRSIVSKLDEEGLKRLGDLRWLPTQFQHMIEGFNVRVHVIGKVAFATQIISESTDYRYASLKGHPSCFRKYSLTEDLKTACVKLARICGLDFAGIDLIINPEKVYCLEVNPSPGYSYYEQATGQPIADALAAYLDF